MKYRILVALSLAVLLSGCALFKNIGGTTPQIIQSARQGVADGMVAADGIRSAWLTQCQTGTTPICSHNAAAAKADSANALTAETIATNSAIALSSCSAADQATCVSAVDADVQAIISAMMGMNAQMKGTAAPSKLTPQDITNLIAIALQLAQVGEQVWADIIAINNTGPSDAALRAQLAKSTVLDAQIQALVVQ